MSWYCWLGTGFIAGVVSYAAFNKATQTMAIKAMR